jgi:hypothetical protein
LKSQVVALIFTGGGMTLITSGRIYTTKHDYAVQRVKYLSELLSEKWVDPVDATWIDAGIIDFVTKQIDKAILELAN